MLGQMVVLGCGGLDGELEPQCGGAQSKPESRAGFPSLASHDQGLRLMESIGNALPGSGMVAGCDSFSPFSLSQDLPMHFSYLPNNKVISKPGR